MPANIASAVSAYAKTAARPDTAGAMDPRPGKDPGTDFASLLKEAAHGAIEAGRQGELKSMEAVAGKADVTEVVTAVSNAEVALQTAVAIRDRVIQAYQEILHMPL